MRRVVLAAALLSPVILGVASATTRPSAVATSPSVSIVPRPRLERFGGAPFVWPPAPRIAIGSARARPAADDAAQVLREAGLRPVVLSRAHAGDLVLRTTRSYDVRLGEEGYALDAGPRGVVVRANDARGLAYGVRTLSQMTERTRDALVTAGAAIVDRPQYRWRGIHLDAARHFFSVSTIERYIDVAAHYKLNVFHWHLTDDQAWRFDDPQYPALGRGIARYSADDVRRVVAYAARRYVTVVPEIDMPAHMSAAVRAYPALRCGRDVLCTDGAGLAFAHDVLSHAVAAFPSPYVHVGGDEVPPPAAQRQPAFTANLERHLEAQGRRLVGWDEIAQAPLSPRTVVMLWSSRERALRALHAGNDVVVTWGPLYFDRYQGDPAQEPLAAPYVATLEEVYDDPVIPAGASERDARHVLGVQANVWTEKIRTPEHLFAMTLPRLLALAEISWTPRARKSWPSFLQRLPAQLAWLDAHGYPYRVPNVLFDVHGGPLAFTSVAGRMQSAIARTPARTVTIALRVPVERPLVRYTLDGTVPTAQSPRYRTPFALRLDRPVRLAARAYAAGRAGEVTRLTLLRASSGALGAGGSTSFAGLVSP